MIPLLGEMSAKQTKGCPNSENFAPAANSHQTLRREQAPALPYKMYVVRPFVGGDDSAPRCRGGSPCPPANFDVISRNNTKVVPYES